MIEVIGGSLHALRHLRQGLPDERVFDEAPNDLPVIARQEDCQTCFQCEAYCPADALFVSPLRTPAEPGSEWRDEAALSARNQLGLYRTRVGLNKKNVPETAERRRILRGDAGHSALARIPFSRHSCSTL